MKPPRREPTALRELLDTLAGRIQRVDLRLIDELRVRWREGGDPVLAERCRPEYIDRGVLIISVPSGAFAERIREETPSLLALFSYLGPRAPTSLRTVQKET